MTKPAAPQRARREHLPGCLVGCRLFRYDTLPSTMDEARRLAQRGAPEGSVVVTAAQTQGRGRFGRSWVSPPGACVTLSVVLAPGTTVLPKLSIGAAVGVMRAIRRLTGLPCSVKWPNDVLLNGQKVCGILVESELTERGRPLSILGIGLNVNLDPVSYPDIADSATSLARETGEEQSLAQVEAVLLEELDAVYAALHSGDAVLQEWRSALETLGRRVEVRWGDTVERGLARDVDEYGRLVLDRDDGSTVVLAAGEVTLQQEAVRRPSGDSDAGAA